MRKFKFLLKICAITAVILVLLYASLYLYAHFFTHLKINSANGYYIYDNNMNLINATTDQWIPMEAMSEYIPKATIAIEDKHFYSHNGFDYLRILKSMYVNVVNNKTLQGASTITQQYAKNLFLSFDQTWSRKLKEAWIAIKLESNYSKDQILEGYLNTINYGGVYGIENASYYYYNKSASDLNLAEASMLAGIPKSPSNYSPLVNLKEAKRRQKLVLEAMVKNKFITSEEMDEAYNYELIFYGSMSENINNTLLYYQDAVMDELESLNIPTSLLDTGGLRIYTCLDLGLQNLVDRAIKDNFADGELQTAIIVENPQDGGIMALSGGVDYNKSPYNRATKAKRQVGSTIKPFLYYAALENGFTASTTFTSEPTTFIFSNDQTYSPANYNNKYGEKNISMAAAIAYSDNIYAVKTHLFLGEEVLVEFLNRVGIANMSAVPSLALGSNEINLLTMTNAYSVLASGGYKNKAHFINKVETLDGKVLYEYKEEKEKILNGSLVFIMNELLTSTYNYNFVDYNYPTLYDLTNELTHKYAIKTGTTDTDHLIFGYNPDILIGIWSGFDDNRESGSDNGKAIKKVWSYIAEEYLKDKNDSWYDIPNNVIGVLVDPISGQIATNSTANPTMFYYLKGTQPNASYEELDDLVPTLKNIENGAVAN